MATALNSLKYGQIVWVDLGLGEGHEQEGHRPCVVFQNNKGNHFSGTLVVIPVSQSATKSYFTRIKIPNLKGYDGYSIALCEQIRCIDKSRVTKIERMILKDKFMSEISNAVIGNCSKSIQNVKVVDSKLQSVIKLIKSKILKME